MEWIGWRRLVFGLNAHRRWHYTGPLGPPIRHVKWFLRSVGAPSPETAINLWHSLAAWATGSDPPWVKEWREAMEADEPTPKTEADLPVTQLRKAMEKADVEAPESEADEAAGDEHPSAPLDKQVDEGGCLPSVPRSLELLHLTELDESDVLALSKDNEKTGSVDGVDDGASTSSSVRSARALARYKRILALSGFAGVYITWAIFSWFIFVSARPFGCSFVTAAPALTLLTLI